MTYMPPPLPTVSSASKPASQFAIVSMVLGIASFVLLGPFGSIPAIIFGHLALRQIRRQPNFVTGRGLAIAGLATGYTNLSLSLIALAILIPVLAHARTASREVQCMTNLRNIGTAAQMYASDNKGYLPARFDDVVKYVPPQVTGNVWLCPFDRSGSANSYQLMLPSQRINNLRNPSDVVWARDKNPHPNRSSCLLFLDGHTECLTPQKIAALPPVRPPGRTY